MTSLPTVLNVYKRRGETPLECLKRLQAAAPELQGQALTYAGRLDPLAEGVLLVLVGEEAKRKDVYLTLRKSYRVEVLFGFSTDTYDLAGKLTDVKDGRVQMVSLMEAIGRLPGTFEQKYPPYSSKTVDGKPLFMWAREGRLEDITIPGHVVTVYESILRHSETISGEDLWKQIQRSLYLLTGDFRQEEISNCWREYIGSRYERLFDVATLEVTASSGTYMRALAHELGRALGIPALAYSIVRTSVGTYTLEESLKHFEEVRPGSLA